jgi:hypothetical protein
MLTGIDAPLTPRPLPVTMSEGATEPRKASAWPVFVAVGLAVAEIGVFLDGLYPLAVAGLLLFVGSIAGIVSEAGYVDRPWRLLGGLGAVLVAAGVLVVYSQVGTAFLDAFATPDGVVFRGFAIAGAGVVAVAGGLAGAFVVDAGREPLPP